MSNPRDLFLQLLSEALWIERTLAFCGFDPQPESTPTPTAIDCTTWASPTSRAL